MSEFSDRPKAMVNDKYSSIDNLKAMLEAGSRLYDTCISTFGFGFHFNQIANKAIHFDYLIQKGIVPKDYLKIKSEDL